MAAPVIARGRVVIEAEQDVARVARRAERAFDRAMEKMNNRRAELAVDANVRPLQRKVEQAEKKLHEWERKRFEAEIGVDEQGMRRADQRIKEWERKLSDSKRRRDEIVLDTDKAKLALRDLQKLDRDAERAHNRLVRTYENGAGRIERAVRSSSVAFEDAIQRDRDNIQALESDFAKLHRRIGALKRERMSRILPGRRASIDLDISAAMTAASRLRDRMLAAGEDETKVVNIEYREQNAGALRRMIDGFSDATVRIGPFTTSVGSAARALTLLAPVITSVIGALGALIGVLGSATLGAGGVALALGGLLPLFGGLAMAMKPLVGDFGAAMKAQKKLSDATLKYGKDSKQAQKAQDELQQTLKGMDPAARSAVMQFGKLRDTWTKLTQDTARAQFGRAVNESMTTANTSVGMFARQTNTAMRTVGDAISSAMQGMRTPGAQGRLDQFFSNMNNVLPPLLSGLGNLAVAVGRVMLSFSRGSVLGRMIQDFNVWTQSVRDGAEDTDKLNSRVDRMAESFRNVVGFVRALGRVLGAFFGASVGPGNDLLKSMTDNLNELADSMEKPGTRRDLQEWFKEASSTAKQAWEVLRPLLQLFVEWATIMRPVAHVLLSIIEPLADLTATAMGLKPVRAIILGVFSALLARRVFNSLRSLVGEVRAFGRGLRNLRVPNAVLNFFRRGRTPVSPTIPSPTTSTGGVRPAPPVGVPARDLGRNVVVIGNTPLPVKIVGSMGRQGGRGGSTTIIPGGAPGPNPRDAGKSAGKFRQFFGRVMERIRSIPGVGRVAALIVAGVTFGGGLISRLGGKIRGALGNALGAVRRIPGVNRIGNLIGRVFGGLGRYLGPALRRALGSGFSMAFKGLGKLVPVLGWAWLIHDLLPDTPRKAVDEALGFMKDAFVDQIEHGWGMITGAWDWVKNGADDAADWVADRAHDIAQGASDAWSSVTDAASGAFDGVVDRARTLPGQVLAALNPLNRVRLVVDIAQRGGELVRRMLDRIRNTRLGRKVQQIAERGANIVRTAINRIRNLRLARKVQQLAERGGALVRRVIERIRDIKLVRKVQQLAERGSNIVRGAINRIRNLRFVRKVQQIAETGASNVRNAINRIRALRFVRKVQQIAENGYSRVMALLNRIKTVAAQGARFVINVVANITSIPGKIKSKLGLAQGGSAAVGHSAGLDVLRNAMETGARTRPTPTSATPRSRANGQAVSRPTYLVGEENRREYVVSTNPAYRGRNQRIVATAARDLGLEVVQPAAQGFGGFSGSGYYAATQWGRAPAAFNFNRARWKKADLNWLAGYRKKGRRRPRLPQVRTPKYDHLQRLLTHQDDLDRELSIRAAGVTEPDDFIVQTGTNPDGDPIFGLDQAAIQNYVSQLAYVKEVQDALVALTAQIVSIIPQVQRELANAREGHQRNISTIQQAISRERRRKASGSRTAMLRSLNTQLSHERAAVGQIQQAQGTTDDVRKEAGFDYREYALASMQLAQEAAAVQGKAEEQQRSANPQEGGAGGGGDGDLGGGAGEQALSYGQQAMIRDTERFNLMREHGGNAYTTSPGAAGGTGTAGGGMQQSYAQRDPAAAWSGGAARALGGTSGGGMTMLGTMATTKTATTQPGTYTASGGGAPVVDSSKIVNITNNFETQPDDPHLWSQGMAFEVNTAL